MSKSEEIICDWHQAKNVYLQQNPESKETLTEIIKRLTEEVSNLKEEKMLSKI